MIEYFFSSKHLLKTLGCSSVSTMKTGVEDETGTPFRVHDTRRTGKKVRPLRRGNISIAMIKRDDRNRTNERRRRRRNVNGNEGTAREFAGRLKHGSTISRPQTPKLDSTSLRPTNPPSSSVPHSDKGWLGTKRA